MANTCFGCIVVIVDVVVVVEVVANIKIWKYKVYFKLNLIK